MNEELHGPSEDALKPHLWKELYLFPKGWLVVLKNFPVNLQKTPHESGQGLIEVQVLQTLPDPLTSLQQNLPVGVKPIFDIVEICPEDGTSCAVTENFQLPVEVIFNLDHLETSAGNPAKGTIRPGDSNRRKSTRMKRTYTLRSSIGKNNEALQSSTVEKLTVLEPNDQTGDSIIPEASKQAQRRTNRTIKGTGDEYLKIKRNLSYFLNRIKYEQSLIDAYSSEGWKGLSLEKLKPEKELQRASSEITRRKLKIRDLFQRLDSLCAEGRHPDNLFDEEGMIDSEDIFCAKCGSKELTLDNDIILCDGACERGFHQFCLEPPLRKEEIPPGDEGWLCPGCDCKVECLDILNESQGTKLSITDNWEKVFPEVVKAGNGDAASGLSSEDSEDEDFDPDRQQTDGKNQEHESCSDDSEYATASENSEPRAKDDPYLGLPSEDSEDDDFDPDTPKPDMMDGGSSSSDFTSDSEDLEAALVEDNLHELNGFSKSSSSKHRRGPKRRSSEGGDQKQAENVLQSLLESEPIEGGDTATISARRSIERLDYKKLYDETYDSTSESSDDEDWTDDSSPKRPKQNDKDEEQRADTDVSINRTRGKQKSESASMPAAATSTGTKNRLGEDVKKRLHEAFVLNHYPDRATKENLAAELGISFLQVDKWFGNARWSYNHPSGRKVNVSAKDVDMKVTVTTHLPQSDSKSEEEIVSNIAQNEGNRGASVTVAGSKEKEAKGKELLEQSEEPNNKAASTTGKKRGRPAKSRVL